MPHYLGICIGFPTMVAAVGFGLSNLFLEFPLIHQMIKFAGMSYLLWLAWKIAKTETSKMKAVTKPFTFLQAALFQWVNPKAWVMTVGAIATYTTVGGNLELQLLAIATAFFLVAFPCVGVWLFFGVALQRILKSPKQRRIFNVTMAILLVFSILPMLTAEIGF